MKNSLVKLQFISLDAKKSILMNLRQYFCILQENITSAFYSV